MKFAFATDESKSLNGSVRASFENRPPLPRRSIFKGSQLGGLEERE
jgi:hypothetical protein